MPPAITLSEAQNKAIIGLHAAGAPSRQIARLIGGIDHSTVCRRLKHLTPRKATEIYKNLRADIFAEQQRKIIMQCHGKSPKEILSLLTGLGILYDKERLERGQSTANVEMHSLSLREVELQAQLERLKEAKLSTGSQNLPKGQKDE